MSSCKDIHTVEILDAIRRTVQAEIQPSYPHFTDRSKCFNAASGAVCVGLRLGLGDSKELKLIQDLADSILDIPIDNTPTTTTKCL